MGGCSSVSSRSVSRYTRSRKRFTPAMPVVDHGLEPPAAP
jgi:hypothetical protein